MEFPEKLKTLRAEANLTQNELAEKLVISRQAISNYEQGRSYPSIDILVGMCKLFNTSLDDLLSSGVRKQYMKQMLVLSGLMFINLILSILSIFFLMQKETLSTLYAAFSIAIHIIPFICLFVYLLFQYKPPKKANKLYGYRTKLSMKNQLTWDYAQTYFSLVFAGISILLLCLGCAYSIVSMFLDINTCLIVGCALFCIQAISLLFPVFFVEKKLKQIFQKMQGKLPQNK